MYIKVNNDGTTERYSNKDEYKKTLEVSNKEYKKSLKKHNNKKSDTNTITDGEDI